MKNSKKDLQELLMKILHFAVFYRWHPEVSLRYLPISSEIKKMKNDVTVLEVGSGGLGIAPYLKKPITGADLKFLPPYHQKLKRIKATATNLPFKNSSFDVVLSVDTLEHIKKDQRKKAISEILRVAKSKVFIAVPCGQQAQRQDIRLQSFCQKNDYQNYAFLEEHIKNDLPKKEEILDYLKRGASKYNKKIRIMTKGNENLFLHEFLMKGFMKKGKFNDIIFRKVFLFAIPIFRLMNMEPTYRKIFIVDII